MDTTGKILDILFRRTSPERVLKSLCSETKAFPLRISKADAAEGAFLACAETTLSGYSEDEQRLLFRWFREHERDWAESERLPTNLLIPLIMFGQEVLTVCDEEPRCQTAQVLRWREVYLCLSQDMIVCPYLAHRDFMSGYRRTNFAWPAVIRTDNNALQQMLAKGMAENHAHLNGSTQSFALTWCRLMNFPEHIADDLPHFSVKLQHRMSRGTEDNMLPLNDQLVVAALARSILFRALHRDQFQPRGADGDKPKIFDGQECFGEEYINSFSPLAKLQSVVAWLRQCYGCMIPFPDGETFCLDYALEPEIFIAVQNSAERVLAGERYFLYQCSRACIEGGFTSFEQELFYLYLLLKTSFRSEMIQVNKQVGFQNFANYQDRKDDAWNRNLYWWEANRLSLSGPLKRQHIVSFETRFGPACTPQEDIDRVVAFDRAKRFADCSVGDSYIPENYEFNYELDAAQFLREKYFFVFHFSKAKDDIDPFHLQPFELICRHDRFRRKVRQRALALAEALSNSAYLCYRVRGIDACSNEIGCRPENFAVAFRFLGDFQTAQFASRCALLPRPIPHLSKTYHVGEDFLDIADGLRAIDEAVHFLQLQRGNRIGHALALGVDPKIHYRTKSYTIVTTKQNRLDDLVWLLFRGQSLGVAMEPQLRYTLWEEAHRLFREIYGCAVHDEGWHCDLDEYFCSTKLRGDDPSLYRSKKYQGLRFPVCPYDLFLENNADPSLGTYRADPRISGLYYYYHYGVEEKKNGAQKITITVTEPYIELMYQMQTMMQRFLEEEGLIIECNPSSNVLIGTFQSYRDHPVFRFNNTGLVYDSEAHENCPQLHVCINTDDLGVFDTSLEFEYALLYQCLKESSGDADKPPYKSRDIMNYLDYLRDMGLQAVFPRAQSTIV